MSTEYTIGELARLARVTVRTLHHYDAIGLLRPSDRTESGYRLYTRAELERLHQIRLWRELGLSLDRIAALLDDRDFDRRTALEEQRDALLARIADDRALVSTIEKMLKEDAVSDKELFDGFDPEEHQDEAEKRWGGTSAWKESQRRYAGYTADQKRQMKEETSGPYARLQALREQGVSADSAQAMAAAEDHRLAIERWFYPCPTPVHLGLADLYEADPRFAASIDAHGEGLTTYVVAAIRANAAR